MRTWTCGLALVALGTFLPLSPGGEPAKGGDYTALSRLIQKMMAGQLPKVFEHDSNWGQTVPIPEKLALPRLRTVVKVGDRDELPHGLWRRMRGRLDDPERDLTVRVRNLEMKDGKYRLSLDADVALRGEAEVQHWQKGLALVNLLAEADVVITLALECDVKVKLDAKGVKLEPQVTDLKMTLKEFTLRRLALRRLGPILEGEQAEAAGGLVKGLVGGALESLGPQMKDQLNQSLARGAAEGKSIPAGELLKALSPAAKK